MNNTTFSANNLFLKTRSKSYSYKDLSCFSAHFKETLQSYDIQKDKPIGLCGQPCDEMIFIVAGCWMLNIPFVVFNHHLPASKITRQIERLQPGLIITDNLKEKTAFQTLSFDVFKLKKILKTSAGTDQYSLSHISPKKPSKEDIFGYFFTSGTSSAPKIVPLKRRQIISAAKSSAANILPEPNECWLLCMPLFHVGGISIILRSMLYGSAIFFMDTFNKQDVSQLLSSDSGVVVASLVPTMYKRLLENQKFSVHQNLQAILLGGEPVSNRLIEKSLKRHIPIITSYGMTETCAQIAANPLSGSTVTKEQFQSAGAIFEPNRIEIRNDDNKPAKTGTLGNVWLKGPQVFDGYLSKIANNIDDNGWFKTGDFGKLDGNGRLYIESRRTDLIITGGENVSPKEVEEVLAGHNAVKETVVFGIPDEDWGEQVTAAIIPSSSKEVPPDSLKKYLEGQLASYKIPKQFIYVDELPRTHNGKIQRSKLKELIGTRLPVKNKDAT